MKSAILVLALLLTAACGPPTPSTGRVELEEEVVEEPTPSTCGDGICDPDENSTSCPVDCEIGETTDEAEAIEEAVELILEEGETIEEIENDK